MRIRAKLSVVFSVTCLFMIGVGIAAILLVGRLRELLEELRYDDYQSKLLAYTVQDLHRAPADTAGNLANLDDLGRYVHTPKERQLVDEARGQVAQNPAAALSPLDHLATYYRESTQTAHEQLRTYHRRAVFGIVIALIDGLILVVLVLAQVRFWLLVPVQQLQEATARIASGDLKIKIPVAGGPEVAALTGSLNEIIAALREARERLVKSERLARTGEVATQVAHSLRTPLESIRKQTERGRDAPGVEPDARAAFEQITATVEVLERWVGDIVRSARSLELKLARRPVEPVVHDALSLLRDKLAAASLQARVEAPASLPDVFLDVSLLQQALVALLDNAIEASPAHAPILVRLDPDPPAGVVIRIEDLGDGMSADIREKAFDEFYSTKPGRAGLGLAIARRIVRLHGGTIELASDPGQGTRVLIHLPSEAPGPAK